MSKPLITALIDTYNHEHFIEEAINSVLNQNFPQSELEVLVIDDGSTDATSGVVRKFLPRIRLVRKENGGQASAFNVGISQARGEIVAFLDGDDWWAPGKLTAVAQAFNSSHEVGLVGHGVTEVCSDGRQRTEVPREVCRYRLVSPKEAKQFRLTRGFLGTSRMAYRREILGLIGPVPEALKFEADEYLFTLAGLFADVMILNRPFTFYRVHDKNLFQLSSQDPQALRRKYTVLTSLAESLQHALREHNVPLKIARIILECVEVEADVMALRLDGGFPWQTLSTELKLLQVFHSDASIRQHLFSYLRLIPAVFLPARSYYSWRDRITGAAAYKRFRRRFLPFPVPRQVERTDSVLKD